MATGLSYTTIHRWYARFRQHLPSDGGELLSGVVAVDEAWFGKQRHSKRGKQTIVMGGIEVDTRRCKGTLRVPADIPKSYDCDGLVEGINKSIC